MAKHRPFQINVVAGKQVKVNFIEHMGKNLYPHRPGRMTGAEGYRALAEVDFGPDPDKDSGKHIREFVPRECLIPA